MDSNVEWFELFIEIYNMGAALVMLFMITHILVMLRKINKNLLKARMFLGEDVLHDTWLYASIASASFALHSIISILVLITDFGMVVIYQVTEIIFIMSFVIMIYQWYVFIRSLQTGNK